MTSSYACGPGAVRDGAPRIVMPMIPCSAIHAGINHFTATFEGTVAPSQKKIFEGCDNMALPACAYTWMSSGPAPGTETQTRASSW